MRNRLITLLFPLLGLITAGCSEEQEFTINDLQDVNGLTLGIRLGSTHEQYVAEDFPDSQILLFDVDTDLFNALLTGKTDVIGYDYLMWLGMQDPEHNISVLKKDWHQEPFGMIFPKEATGLLKQYNTFLKELKTSGELTRIQEKWVNERETAEMPDLSTVPRSGKPLRVACTGTTAIFDFVRDGKNCGLDIEIIERFAAYLGRPVEYKMMNFGGLIAATSSGIVDLASSSICITEERSRQVNFGDSYFQGPQCLLVRTENLPADRTGHPEDRSNGSGEDIRPAGLKAYFSSIAESFHNNLIRENRWKLIVSGLWQTVLISVLSILFGTVLGAGICAMRMSPNRLASRTAQAFIDLVRGIPVLVLLMILFYIVFARLGLSGTAVAVIAFTINFAAYTSEMFRSGLESLDPGQRKAGIAMGFTNSQTFRYITLPQLTKRVLPVFKGEAVSLVKTTSIVGYIAVADLTKASDIIRSRTFDAFFPLIVITVIYFILAWLLGKALDQIGKNTK